MGAAFAELLGRSCFSFLEGASQPRDLVLRSQELGHEALALCDRDGLYGSVRAHQAAKECGHPLIVGAELTIAAALPITAAMPIAAARPYHEHAAASVALLVQSQRGYTGLCRLLTRAHAGCEKGEASITAEAIANEAEDLFAVLPIDPRKPFAASQLEIFRQAFGKRCAIAVWRHLCPQDEPRMQTARGFAATFDIPIVASNRPTYHHRSRKPLADVLTCIRLKTTLDEAGTRLSPNAEAELKGGNGLERLFPDHPEWLSRSLEIAHSCDFSLQDLQYHFPSEYGVPALTPDENLRMAVETGCYERYPEGLPADVRQQLEKELSIIAELNVAPYFLSVQQIVQIARQRSILCQGRGSAANSAVCYVLGITAVDPVRSSLLFERFMSTARDEPPDIDVDFEHERREEVIQEIYQRYGRDRAAMVSEIIAYRGKSSLREVGKVFGLSNDQLDRLSSIASHFSAGGDDRNPTSKIDHRREALRKRGLDVRNRRLHQTLQLAQQLEGFPRHLSIHVGGFVLSSEPLDQVAPIEPARMADRSVIPWDKDDIEVLGFFKVDVLGLGMLTAIRKAQALIHTERHCHGPNPIAAENVPPLDPIAELASIPPKDSAVYDAVCRADTIGVFQIESRAQMAMLPILRPRCFYDLVIEVGIVRPGPIQGKMVHPYLRRRTGEEIVRYPHPCLKPILERTLGVPLFQEQVMQLAIVGAGYTPGEADQLRRDMAAWRKNGRLARHRDKLLSGFRERQIPAEFGERLYQQILGFGEYGFPESHAASFALLVYASAWIKVHHPAAFACALINSQPMGFYSPASIVRDAQKHGVEVRPSRVEHSQWDCTLEYPDPVGPSGSAGKAILRLGLRLIRGLRQAGADSLLEARAERPFASLEDLVLRTSLKRNERDALAEAGALEGLLPSRREALWQLRAPREGGLYRGKTIEPTRPVGLPRLSAQEQLTLDYGTVGISLHDHPMNHLDKQLRRRQVQKAERQCHWRKNQQVTVAGVVLTRQRPMTASGVVFVTLEDQTGSMNIVLYTTIFERYELVARHAGIMLVRGRVDRRGDVVHVRAQHLERLDLPKGQPLALQSRDFH